MLAATAKRTTTRDEKNFMVKIVKMVVMLEVELGEC
jgi:hypothetical protein